MKRTGTPIDNVYANAPPHAPIKRAKKFVIRRDLDLARMMQRLELEHIAEMFDGRNKDELKWHMFTKLELNVLLLCAEVGSICFLNPDFAVAFKILQVNRMFSCELDVLDLGKRRITTFGAVIPDRFRMCRCPAVDSLYAISTGPCRQMLETHESLRWFKSERMFIADDAEIADLFEESDEETWDLLLGVSRDGEESSVEVQEEEMELPMEADIDLNIKI